jgi:hypothetical protein
LGMFGSKCHCFATAFAKNVGRWIVDLVLWSLATGPPIPYPFVDVCGFDSICGACISIVMLFCFLNHVHVAAYAGNLCSLWPGNARCLLKQCYMWVGHEASLNWFDSLTAIMQTHGEKLTSNNHLD